MVDRHFDLILMCKQKPGSSVGLRYKRAPIMAYAKRDSVKIGTDLRSGNAHFAWTTLSTPLPEGSRNDFVGVRVCSLLLLLFSH